MSVTFALQDTVGVIHLGDDENRFSPEWMDSLDAALDACLDSPAAALVTRAGDKFYSNGLVVDQLLGEPEASAAYIARVEGLLARMLTFPMHTVAAMPGHAFGGGAMLALAHDASVMRLDRGFICYPEVDLGMPFPPGMAALIQGKLPAQTWVEAMTTGRRYGALEAQRAQMIHDTADLADLVDVAVARAAAVGAKDRAAVGRIKEHIFAPIVAVLTRSVR